MQDNSSNSSSPKPPRNGLRLVNSVAETAPEATAVAAEKPRRKSSLVQFMTAYADSIDRDVKLLLDI